MEPKWLRSPGILRIASSCLINHLVLLANLSIALSQPFKFSIKTSIMVALTEKAKENLNAILVQAVAEGKVPGAAFVVGTADKKLYSGAAGFKAFNDPSAGRIDDDSVFWVCSHTKLFATVALLQLIEAGKLSYNTPAEDIIPELKNPVIVDDVSSATTGYRPAKTKILIRHLVNHTSGLYYSQIGKPTPETLNLAYTAVGYGGDYSVEKFFNILRQGGYFPSVPLAFEPGTNWNYGYSCDIMGFIVERISGKSLHQFCNENIFRPLGMNTAGFFVTPEMRKRQVELSFRRKDGLLEKWDGQLSTISPLNDPAEGAHILLGGVGLYTTLDDNLTLLRHLLLVEAELARKAGRAENPILSSETVSSLFVSSIPAGASKNIELFTGWSNVDYGIGLCLASDDWPGRRRKGSGFWYGWAGTYYFMDPATGIVVVYGTQVVPSCDEEVVRLWEQLERAVYAGLDEER